MNRSKTVSGPFMVLAMVLLSTMLLSGCKTTQEHLMDSDQSQVALRQIQARIFDTTDQQKTLRTVIATLQDLEFVIDKADIDLGVVSATKLKGYALSISVAVSPHGTHQMRVRANAQYNITPVTDPEPYQNFFAALEKAMFLVAALDSPSTNTVETAKSRTSDKAEPQRTAGADSQKQSSVTATIINDAKQQETATPIPTAPTATPHAEVEQTVHAWAAAWSSRNVDDYLAFYSASFLPEKGISREAWKNGRDKVLNSVDSIRVTLANMKITIMDTNQAKVTFMQDYWSNTYQDKIMKTLMLKKDGGAWRIVREYN